MFVITLVSAVQWLTKRMPDHYTMSTVVADRLKLRHMLDLICKVIIALEIAEWVISMTALIADAIFMQ